MPPETTLDARIAQWTTQALARLLATFALLQGGNIIVGGRARWSAESFTIALTVPGAPPSWGWALALPGALALAGSLLARRTIVMVGLFAVGVWCAFFALSFAATALTSVTSATTGVFAYGTMAAAAITIAMAYRVSKRWSS